MESVHFQISDRCSFPPLALTKQHEIADRFASQELGEALGIDIPPDTRTPTFLSLTSTFFWMTTAAAKHPRSA
jgi:hypothetical protein